MRKKNKKGKINRNLKLTCILNATCFRFIHKNISRVENKFEENFLFFFSN